MPARNVVFCYIAAMDPRASVTRCARPILTRAGERFGCRRCDYCLWRDARELQRRCEREFYALKAGRIAFMGSLTFADEALRQALAQDKPGRAAWRAFSVRLTQLLAEACGEAAGVKLFAMPEKGSQHGRLHVHFLAFGVPEVMALVTKHEGPKLYPVTRFRELVRQAWPHGFEKCDAVWSLGGVRYVLKYVRKGVTPLRQAGQALASSWWWCAFPRGRVGMTRSKPAAWSRASGHRSSSELSREYGSPCQAATKTRTSWSLKVTC